MGSRDELLAAYGPREIEALALDDPSALIDECALCGGPMISRVEVRRGRPTRVRLHVCPATHPRVAIAKAPPRPPGSRPIEPGWASPSYVYAATLAIAAVLLALFLAAAPPAAKSPDRSGEVRRDGSGRAAAFPVSASASTRRDD